MPFDYGLRLHNRQRLANARAKPIEANKNQSVDGAEGLFLRSGSPQNVYLLPQHPNFRLERCPRPKQICDHPNNEPDKISHPATASPDSRSTASQIEFAIGTPCGSVDESRRCAHHWNASADQPIVWRRDRHSIHGNLRAPSGADSLQPNRSPRRQPWEVNGRSIGGLSECRRRSHLGFGNGHSASNQFARVGGREAGVCSRVYRRLPRRNRRRSDLPLLRDAPTGNEIRSTRRPMTGIVAKMTSERRRLCPGL
jgi:hypothetical protein